MPDDPDFVVIKITPFAPLEPYIAVADASFKIVIFSMSLGLIRDNGLILYPFLVEDSLISSFINGIPSIT